ncbi:transcriptional regulator [Streptomyces aidingensis]|uniref:Transcriptional regulator n=1 Tax=Streptomyces aidingensis TaxID=910347 RepID=A0A1I1ICL9_9ACTN|nr:transcriptional regulator [Streptomyces aidingensis]SFC34139.1 hypothetical protein SAMN05421773_1034 [Streptomyces aidingensis]
MARREDRAFYVHPLSVVRADRGWTQQNLVDVVARRLGNAGNGRQKAWRWEHRGVTPDRPSQLALAAELGVPPERVRQEPWPCWLPDGDPVRTDFGWTQPGSISALEDAVEHGMRDRRGFMKLTGAALVGLAEEWLRIEPSELAAAVRGGQVTHAFVDRLEDGVPRLRFLEAERGGLRARQLISAELGMVVEVLDSSSYTTEIGKRLFALAGELSRMAGWACFDAGLHAAAQRYWTAALHVAHAAGDRTMGANVLKSMSLQCYDAANHREALALARSAYEGAGQTTPRARAMFALREARAHAALGDPAACERLLGEAEHAISKSGPADEDPPWLGYFDGAEFWAQVGTCYLDLSRARHRSEHSAKAEAHLERTLQSLPRTKIRDRATYVTRRATAQAQLGELDHACHLLTEAIPLIQQAPSRRNTQHLLTARASLPLNKRDRRVRELDEQLTELELAS